MNFINFNNAGSSQTFKKTINEITRYLKDEENLGGYFCADLFKKKLNNFYINLSQLLNCEPDEISFISNTTVGYNYLINSLKFKKNSNILIFENEYESNLICLLRNKIKFRIVRCLENGEIDYLDLKSKIDKDTCLVSLCHLSSHTGNLNSLHKITEFIKKIKPEIFILVDVCQSVGQIEIDFKKINCDAMVGSGRKYLRGPRGTGFLILNKKSKNNIIPLILDSHNFSLSKKTLKKKKIFENFEHSPALKVGLSNSIKQINMIGIKKIEMDIKKKSLYLRKKLQNYKRIRFFENILKISGINTFIVDGVDIQKVYEYMINKKILISVVNNRFPLKYKKKKSGALRVSIHYYNTYKQLDYLVKCLSKL